jgi:hypothetical protein
VASDDLRERLLGAICSVRVPVTGDGLLYADESGTMPLFDADEDEAGLLADAVLAVVQPELKAAAFDSEEVDRLSDLLIAAMAERDEARAALARVEAVAQKWRRGYGYEDDSTLVEQTCADRVLAALRTPDGGEL